MGKPARLDALRRPPQGSDATPPEPVGPVRTCVGCSRKATRSVLVRIVAQGATAVVDGSATAPGRGAWLHPDPECLERALRRRSIGRALRVPDLDTSRLVLEGA